MLILYIGSLGIVASNMSQIGSKSKKDLISEIESALDAVDFGSIEIYVQDKTVTQITVRNIKKTSINITASSEIVNKEDQKVFSIHTHFRRTE